MFGGVIGRDSKPREIGKTGTYTLLYPIPSSSEMVMMFQSMRQICIIHNGIRARLYHGEFVMEPILEVCVLVCV